MAVERLVISLLRGLEVPGSYLNSNIDNAVFEI
jgi:hypothetical protein